MKRLVIKVISTIIFLALATLQFNAYDASMSGQVAVGQLNDTYSSSANMTYYKALKDWFWITYIVVPCVVFFTDVKKLIKNK